MADSNNEEAAQPQPLPCESALQPARYCSRCGKEPENLNTCSQCHVAMYCSRPCQRSDWPLHKQFCTKWAAEKGRVTIRGPPIWLTKQWFEPHWHWHAEAAQDPAAQQVASTLGIDLVSECSGPSCRAVDSTLSRLICTGNDTDTNLAIFFGEDQNTLVKNSTAYLDIRYMAYNHAPPGSYAFHAVQAWDRRISQLSWTPRKAPEFSSKFVLQMFYWAKILKFFDVAGLGATLRQKDLPLLLSFLAHDAGDCSWPFAGDSYDIIDALRAALQTIPDFKLNLDFESAGLGFWFIPDEILVLVRNEGVGFKEAAARVLGANCASNCVGCGRPMPVPLVAHLRGRE